MQMSILLRVACRIRRALLSDGGHIGDSRVR